MKYRLRYSQKALRDMDAVWDGVFEASKDIETTEKYANEFMDEIAGRKEYPQSGIPLYYMGLFTGYYSVNYKAYKAFYRIRDGFMEVARILPMKLDYMGKLFNCLDLSSVPDNSGSVFHEGSE